MFISCKFLLSVFLLLGLVLPVFSFEPSGGVLMLDGEDDYAILPLAEHGYIFPRNTDEFTVEVWFYPKNETEPEQGESNIILSQQVRFGLVPNNQCRDKISEKDQICSYGFAFLEGKSTLAFIGINVPVEKDQWNYMAVIFKDSSFFFAYNDEILRTSRINRVNFVAAALPGPEQFKDFFVGGYAEDRVVFDEDGELLSRRTHFHGAIDAIRFSDIARHDLPIAHGFWLFDPPHRFVSDAHTLALWDFNDKEGADRFEDTSGNGRTLIGMNGATVVDGEGVGNLEIRPDNSVTTTWGQIKSESF